jgi:hypothetical protein
LIEVGAYDPNSGLDNADIIDCSRRLNIMVKSWNNTPKIYLTKEVQLTLTPGQESYKIGAPYVMTSVVGAYTVGETVTGGTSAATGVVVSFDTDNGYLILTTVVGTFTKTETLTGGTSLTTGVYSDGDIHINRPVRLESVRREDSSGVEVPIPVVSWQEYKDLPDKSSQGPVNLVMYQPNIGLGTLYVWETGDSSNTKLNLVYQREIEDFSSASDNPDIEKTGYKALYLQLASNIWRMYNPRTPKPQDLIIEAEFALNAWEEHEDESTPMYIQPRNNWYS